MDVLIYGAGQTGRQVYDNIKSRCNVIGFLDGNSDKKGTKIEEIPVRGGVEVLKTCHYDKIYIGTVFWEDVKRTLMEAGVRESDIVVDIPESEDIGSPVRDTFLECYAKQFVNTNFAVAEGGVYRGEFSAVINRCFPNSKLYLFDTFEGFDERDVLVEREKRYSDPAGLYFANTSVELVLSKMKYKDQVEIHKGYFPESAKGVRDVFCFVNLDFDLYHPILEGLRFFYPQMIRGSVILVHDYYHAGLPGVRAAIQDFEAELDTPLVKLPIGDGQSIALVKV